MPTVVWIHKGRPSPAIFVGNDEDSRDGDGVGRAGGGAEPAAAGAPRRRREVIDSDSSGQEAAFGESAFAESRRAAAERRARAAARDFASFSDARADSAYDLVLCGGDDGGAKRPAPGGTPLGALLIKAVGVAAAAGFACELSHCLYLCGETWRKGDTGATNDLLTESLELQCGARAARAAKRVDVYFDPDRHVRGTTQLICAAMRGDLPRLLQLVQLGAPLGLADAVEEDGSGGSSALHWACEHGDARLVLALLDGKYEGRGADVDARDEGRWTPLIYAAISGHEAVVRLLLKRDARRKLEGIEGETALGFAVICHRDACAAMLRA